MANRERPTRTTGGATKERDAQGYNVVGSTSTKAEAEHLARWMRRGGFRAKITGTRGAYKVWASEGKRV